MWIAPITKQRATPEQFNDHYRRHLEVDSHLSSILNLTGNLCGMKVLDLGGGPLLARAGVAQSCRYTLVDFSREVCNEVEQWCRNACVVQGDVQRYLDICTEAYDIVLCFGLLEYLEEGALADLCARCPSRILCLGTSSAESYLQYPGRITIYSADYVEQITSDSGWVCKKKIDMPSHIWARYEMQD